MKINSPVLEQLLSQFNLSRYEWDVFIKTAPYRYKKYKIPKRNGGSREIAQPSKALKIVQKYLLESVLKEMPVHEVATAYKKNTSIKDHALVHASNKYLLKLDFKSFFPSLNEDDFRKHCKKHLTILTTDDVNILIRLLFWAPTRKRKKLIMSIGAPSSPKLSNSLLYEFDCKLNEYCKSEGVVYTRYADDIALSCNSPDVLFKIQRTVESLCQTISYPKKLKINQEKTVHTSKKEKRFLTGLVLSNDGTVSLGRDKKREVRARIHSYAKSPSSFDESVRNQLKGYLLFAMSIDENFVNSIESMMIKINENSYNLLMA